MRWMAGLSLGLAWLGASAVRWGVPDDWRPHAWVARQMDGLPAGATVLVRGNDPAFLGLYHREVEQRRPDLVWVARPLLGHANFDVELRRRFGPRPGGLDIERIPSGLGDAWDQQRPLFLEVRAQDRPLGTRLGPWGLLFRAAPAGEQAALHPPALARHRHWLRLSLLDPPRSRHGSLVELLWREEAGAHWRELGAPPGLVRAVLPEAVDDTP